MTKAAKVITWEVSRENSCSRQHASLDGNDQSYTCK